MSEGFRKRFEDYFHPGDPSECWEWQGSFSPDGYGRLGNAYAHRISYERSAGPIPDGFHIDHLCRNHACVNPAHLEAVEPELNTRRGMLPRAVQARTRRCKRGHVLTPDNIYIRPDGKGGDSACHACILERARIYTAKRSARRKAAREVQLGCAS